MTFSTPLALVLLVCIPLVLYLGWPRQAYRRARDITSVILRTVILLLLVLSLAGAQAVQSANRLAVIFLVDSSDSVGTKAKEAELAYIRQSLLAMGPDDEAGVVLFGTDALVEKPLNNVRELGQTQSSPSTGNTNLEKAIRLALGMFPADAARRIVVLSDGRATIGNSESAAELAAATGIEISYVQFTPEIAPDIQVTNVTAPSAINAGQNFDLTYTIESQIETLATVSVMASGQVIDTNVVKLEPGSNNFILSPRGLTPGFIDFEVRVDPVDTDAADGFYQNNQLAAFSRVVGPPRILLMYNSEEEIQYLLPALKQAGLTVDTVTPEQLPLGIVSLAKYSTIVLANVPASRLAASNRMETIQSFVRDLGGGLVVIGGPEAYGPGGYIKTPLEDTLPLESQIKDQKRLPQLTIAYVIDRSGSMGAVGPSGIENIELAKEAIIRSLDLLQPTDRAGVVSFDSQGYWIAHLQDVRDRLALQRLVGTLRTGGGTDIMAGMQLVSQDILPDPSNRKHIILLTDGGANPAGLVELSGQLKEKNDITTSVIAIGSGLPAFLEDMARVGGGNYHPVDIVEQIPTIFSQETVLATRSYILENPFTPTITANSPIINGIDASPQLLGYVATTPKQTAEVILRGPAPYNDPLLASWQYGLGRAVAFTSDATARWGANWVSWGNFVRFWSQAVRWTITESKNSNIESRVVMEGDHARVIVDARDQEGNFLNGMNLNLTVQQAVVDSTQAPPLLSLQQVAPGRYETTFTPDEGAYILHIRGQTEDQSIVLDQTSGWVMSYSAEYNPGRPGDGTALLEDLAHLTGGQSLREDPRMAFAHNLVAQAASTPMWNWMMLVALLLLPVDIAVRRLIITRSDLQRLQRWAFARRGAETTSERLSTLMDAKQRGRQRAEEIAGTSTASNLLKSRRLSARGDSPNQPASSGKPGSEFADRKPEAPQGNVAGELLKKRKEREK